MVARRFLLACVLLCPLAAAQPAQQDTVNERLPVSAAELEAHWQVDCGATWAAVVASVDSPGCAVSAGLRRTLELCVFIHQPPGDRPGLACPDYRAALESVDATDSSRRCTALGALRQQARRCPAMAPAN